MRIGEVLADQLKRTREWTLMLVADLTGDEWTFQSSAGGQHALWLCGHMTTAQEYLIFQVCLTDPKLDASFRDHFPIGTAIKSKAEYSWPAPAEVLAKMAEIQELTENAVRPMEDALLDEPAFGRDGSKHPHFDTKLSAVGHAVRHEAFHAGQIASLRKAMGKNFLR